LIFPFLFQENVLLNIRLLKQVLKARRQDNVLAHPIN
jgi:hypothetical protein